MSNAHCKEFVAHYLDLPRPRKLTREQALQKWTDDSTSEKMKNFRQEVEYFDGDYGKLTYMHKQLALSVSTILFQPSELGGPSGKLLRFVSCVPARGAYVRSDLGEKVRFRAFPFPFSPREVFPFPSALQGPIQLQLALSVLVSVGAWF